jgi:hypothetical protein
MPNPNPTLEKIHFLMYPEDTQEVMRLRAQKKPLLCRIPLMSFHNWSPSKNGISYCLNCGRVNFYVGITGLARYMEEKGDFERKT